VSAPRLPAAALALLLLLAGCGGQGGPEGNARQSDANRPAGAEGAATTPAAADAAGPGPATEAAATTVPAVAWKLPMPGEGYTTREGAATFHYYCATCHGNEGRGDGLNAYNLDPKPRDLSDPEFQKKRTDDDLAGVIRSGGGVAGLSTGMPPWGRTLGERKIRNIVAFIRSMKPEAP